MVIIWSPQSIEDIKAIGKFIAKDNQKNADAFIDQLVSSVEHVSSFPESGKLAEENPIFRQISYKGYRLIYQIRTKRILIIGVLGPGQS